MSGLVPAYQRVPEAYARECLFSVRAYLRSGTRWYAGTHPTPEERGDRMATEVIGQEEAQALAALDEAKWQIAVARDTGDVDGLLAWQQRAAAAQYFFQRQSDAQAVANDAGDIKVRAEAALGRLDTQMSPRPGRRGANDQLPDPPPLAHLHTERRAMWRALGQLTDVQLENVIEQVRADPDRGVTTSRAVRLAKELLPRERSVAWHRRSIDRYLAELRKVNSALLVVRERTATAMVAAEDRDRRAVERQLAAVAELVAEIQAVADGHKRGR